MEKIKTIVHIIESEKGWGQKVDEVKQFDTQQEAEDFCEEYNKDNIEDQTPDWYMVAQIVYKGDK